MTSPERLHPCRYMELAVQSLAEGKSSGPWMLYAKLHVAKCPQCRAALEALKNYIKEVKSAPLPSADLPNSFWHGLEDRLDEVEKKTS